MAEIASFGVDVDKNTKLAQNAQDTANDANKKNSDNSQQIANINDPNYLSPFEKPQLEIQMDNFATIYAADKDIAMSEGIDFTAYDAAYQAYLAYMKPLVADMTTYSPIVRSTFNSMVTAVQAEQKRFNAATQAQYSQQINKAKTDIANGQTKYEALQSEAKIMESSAAGIADKANRLAAQYDDTNSLANQALDKASSAQTDASSAVAKAESAASAFGKVDQKADSAFSNAMSAESAASSAVSQASSAAADSKDAKQIAGAVNQSYKMLTDGSTMTIAELQSGLAVKLTKTDLNGYATQDWSQNQIKLTADGINGTISSVKNTVDSQTTSINDLKADSNGFRDQFTTVTDAVGKHTKDISALKVSSKELVSNFDSLSTANGKNEHNISELKQNAKGFSNTLETVQTQVQNSAVGTNLIIQSELKNGYLNGDNGGVQSSSIDFHSDNYIATNGETVFTLSSPDYVFKGNGADDRIAMYDSNKNCLGYQPITSPTQTLSNPNAAYIRFSINSADEGNTTGNSSDWLDTHRYKLEKGSKATDYSVNPEDTATITAVSKISQTIDGMQTDISKKIEQKDLNGYATETWTQGQIKITADGINGTLSKKIEKTDLNGYATQDWAQNQIKITADGISGSLSSVKNTVDSHTTSINTLQTDSDGFKDQFTKVTNTLGKQDTDISTLQADSKSLSSNFDSLDGDNKTNQHNIGELQQSAKEFNSTLVTVKDSLSTIGTPNLVSAYNWTTGSDGGGSPVKTVTHPFYNGLQPLYVINNQTSDENYAYSPRFNLKPNTTYVISLLGFEDVHVLSADVLILARKTGETDAYTKVYVPIPGVVFSPSKAQYVASSAFTTDDNIDSGFIRIDNNGSKDGNNGELFFTEVKLQEGTIATPYTSAQEDLATVTAVSSISQTIDKIQGTIINKADQSQITQLADQITTTVGQISGVNLIPNSDFSQDSQYWNLSDKASIVAHGWKYTDGALVLDPSDTVKDTFIDANVSPNTDYTFSCNMYGTLHVLLVPMKDTTRVWAPVDDDYQDNFHVLTGTDESTPRQSFILKRTSGQTRRIRLILRAEAGTTRSVFTKFQLEEGKIAHAWGPSTNGLATFSQITQLKEDIDLRVKKGDVVNQFNLDAGGALLQTVGDSTKIVFSSPNIIFDSNNPVQIPNANIPGVLTNKTFEAGTITATTKITGSEIEGSLIHSPDNSFKLDGNTGDIVGSSIHAADNSWGISSAGKIHGIGVTASLIDISGDGTGPDYDKNTGNEASPDTSQGIYSRYSYFTSSGYDSRSFGRKIFKNGYLSIKGDTYLNRAIVDWSADGGGVYSYDQMVQANSLKMRSYNFTGSNSQTDNPSDTEGTLSSRIDITPSTISMGTNWSVSDPNVKISSDGTAVFNKVGSKNILLHSAHTLEVSDGQDLWFSDSTGKQNFSLHAQKFIQSSLLSLKTDITSVDPHDALNEVVKNDVMSYHYKTDDPSEPKSVSVILDDINPIPKYYTSDIFKSADGTGRNDGNIVGYLMLSIKDLNNRLQKLEGAN